MEHQDWNITTFNTVSNNAKRELSKKKHSNKTSNPQDFKIVQHKNLGQLICSARAAKSMSQKDLANKIGISAQILSRWESNKEILTNTNIANIEKILGVKLPRNRKTRIQEEN